MFRKWVNNIRSFLRSLFKSRRFLLATAAVCVLVGIGIGVTLIFKDDGDGPKAASSCTEANRDASLIVKNAGSPDDFMTAYETIEANTKTCKPKGGILGIGADDHKDMLEKLQYYHKKATVGSSIGKQAEAKEAAEQGLALDNKLASEEKTLDNYETIIQDLKWVMEGTY